MITKAATTRPVMLIDPVETASTWLVQHMQTLHAAGAAPPIELVAAGDPRFVNTLELAVRFGKWLVVQDVDGVEPLLVPLLRRELVQNGGGWTVALGDKMVDYHSQFRLFLVSRDSTLVLQPNVAPLLLVTNFAITRCEGWVGLRWGDGTCEGWVGLLSWCMHGNTHTVSVLPLHTPTLYAHHHQVSNHLDAVSPLHTLAHEMPRKDTHLVLHIPTPLVLAQEWSGGTTPHPCPAARPTRIGAPTCSWCTAGSRLPGRRGQTGTTTAHSTQGSIWKRVGECHVAEDVKGHQGTECSG